MADSLPGKDVATKKGVASGRAHTSGITNKLLHFFLDRLQNQCGKSSSEKKLTMPD
jgi:hypothetical protein